MKKINVSDDVTIKEEFINAELDDSVKGQWFEIISARDNFFVLKHETGIVLEIPKNQVCRWWRMKSKAIKDYLSRVDELCDLDFETDELI